MIIGVSFTSPDRNLSMNVVNAFVEEFVRWNMEKKLEASQMAREFLMKQIDRAKINLEKAEEDLNRFGKQAGIAANHQVHFALRKSSIEQALYTASKTYCRHGSRRLSQVRADYDVFRPGGSYARYEFFE